MVNSTRILFAVTFWAVSLFCPGMSLAVEVAPRISDREIIESLAELKTGQQSLQQQIDDLKQSSQQQTNSLRQEMNQRFDDMNRRFDDLVALFQILIGALVLVLGGMVAWLIAIWRRLVRVEERQKTFETQDDEIKFLKENFSRLHEMLTQLVLERSRLPQ